MRTHLLTAGFVLMLLIALVIAPADAEEASHGLSYFGGLKYPKDFPHFDYANPDAPKGGRVGFALPGTFNNLHPYVDKGITAAYIAPPGMIYDTLMKKSWDELSSYYGYLAESVELAGDYSWVAYTLRENAYWHDGEPLTVEDVIWTFNTIKTQGSVGWKNSYRDIVSVEQTGPWTFRFNFSETVEKTPQLAIQTASFAPLPKHYWKGKAFNATTLEPPLGSGPYRIKEVDPGHEIVFERVEDYWGKDLNVNTGQHNFDQVKLMYFFDTNVMIQALKAGVFDYYRDQNEKDFATAYDFPGFRKGLFKRETYTMGMPHGMHFGIVLNTRREKLKDIRVREALALAYNFEWANRVFWYGGNKRNNSYFMGSDMAATGLPTAAELELLEPYRDRIPARVFTHPVALPENESFGRNRKTLLQADALLEEAGWVVKDFKRVKEETGEPFTLEFVVSAGDHERMLLPYVDNLKRLGIEAVLRKVDSNLMSNRLRRYQFDATIQQYYQFKIPVPSWLRSSFLSRYVDQPNMGNFAGVDSPAVDFLVEKVLSASSEEELSTAGRALDHWEGLPEKVLGIWEYPLETFMGPAAVCDLTSVRPVEGENDKGEIVNKGQDISPDHLSNIQTGDIVLMWSPYRGSEQPILPAETAKWLADKKIKMLAVEMPGVNWETNAQAPQPNNSPTHRNMLGNNIPITYPLVNVSTLTKERVFYIGLPLSVERLEATWIRAVAFEER